MCVCVRVCACMRVSECERECVCVLERERERESFLTARRLRGLYSALCALPSLHEVNRKPATVSTLKGPHINKIMHRTKHTGKPGGVEGGSIRSARLPTCVRHTLTTQGPSWGYLKVKFSETLSIFGDKCPGNGSNNGSMATSTGLGYPHIEPFVDQLRCEP